MTTANVKGIVTKAVLGAAAMGAFLFAGTAKAQAQFAVGVQFGQPYYATGYYNGGYYEGRRDYDRDAYLDHERREAWERQQAFVRQQEFERREAFARHEAWEHHEREEQFEHGRGYGWGR